MSIPRWRGVRPGTVAGARALRGQPPGLRPPEVVVEARRCGPDGRRAVDSVSAVEEHGPGGGIDLQRLIHEDMAAHFDAYPDNWGLRRPDRNIDHRRVPNLRVFFARHGTSLPVSDDPADYRPGDLVTWMIPGNLPHIGIVIGRVAEGGRRPLIVHNIGAGPRMEDGLLDYPITGHYRYDGPNR